MLVVLKGYPRLSETFIAQELLGLERAGFDLTLISMRRPTDKKRHPVHDEIKARVVYLPEYLHEEPIRVLKGMAAGFGKPGFKVLMKRFWADLKRDLSRNRFRRLGQALVLAREWPDGGEWLHAHFIHTPASVTEYTSILTGTPWTCSAHAKDIWTSPDWELNEKLKSARWTVTCTRTGYEHMRMLTSRKDAVHLSYHASISPASAIFPVRIRPAPGATPTTRPSSSASAAPSRRRATTSCCGRWRCCPPTCIGAWSISAAATSLPD